MKYTLLVIFTILFTLSQTLFAGEKSDGKCFISELSIIDHATVDGEYNVHINFEYENVSEEGFLLYVNGDLYYQYYYNELPINVGPFTSDGESVNHFMVVDYDEEFASDALYGPINDTEGSSDCFLSELTIEDRLCNNGFYQVYLDFEYENVSEEGFLLYINGDLFYQYYYDELPIDVGPFVGDGESVNHFMVVDYDEKCASDVLFGSVECIDDIECNISNVEAIALPCNEDNDFEVLINFEYEEAGKNGFEISGNGINFGTYEYGDLPLILGPFKADGFTGYEFEVKGKEFNSCSDWASIDPFLCNASVQINNMNMTVESCQNRSYYLQLDFDMVSANAESFTLFGNSVVPESYQYDELPLKIGPLRNNELSSYYFIVKNNGPGNSGNWEQLSPFTCESLGFDETIQLKDLVLVYPNPSDGFIQFKNKGHNKMEFEVYDITGNKIKDFILYNNGIQQIYLSEPGLYFYRVNENSLSTTGKFTIR